MKPTPLTHSLFDSTLFKKTITVERNEFLKTGKTTDTNVYFIEKGSLRVFVLDGEEERIVRFGYPGNMIVALDSFLTDQPSDFFIQAIKKSTLRMARKADVEKFIYANETNLNWWNAVLEDLVLQQMEREKDLLTNSPAERYKRVLKRSPQLFQQIPKKHIANYLRMTPETLSRVKKS
ncbi:MAG: Crp/Fnr family transcriptional regulator [Cyclobacteriaceae bacterium]|nr:Crp/Fnr family transcriptional regulator [Cyclobacteriaceae bacterium]